MTCEHKWVYAPIINTGRETYVEKICELCGTLDKDMDSVTQVGSSNFYSVQRKFAAPENSIGDTKKKKERKELIKPEEKKEEDKHPEPNTISQPIVVNTKIETVKEVKPISIDSNKSVSDEPEDALSEVHNIPETTDDLEEEDDLEIVPLPDESKPEEKGMILE